MNNGILFLTCDTQTTIIVITTNINCLQARET